MKRTLTLAAILAVVALTAGAKPLEKNRISADAKWLLHLDMDRAKATQVGGFLIERFLDPKTAKPKADLQRELGFDLDWRKINSATAYGSTFQKDDPSGVLLIESSLAVEAGLEAAIQRRAPQLRVEKLQAAPAPLYRINEQIYLALEKSGLLLVSRSKAAIEHQRAVLAGQQPNLAATDQLKGYPESPFGFFFLAVAEDFGRLAKIPPKAAMLKQAEGGRIVLGEEGPELRLNLDLRAKNAETAHNIRKVVEGLVGLAALQGEQNADLKVLAAGAKVSATDHLVTLGLQMPVADVLTKLAEKHRHATTR